MIENLIAPADARSAVLILRVVDGETNNSAELFRDENFALKSVHTTARDGAATAV